VATNLQSVITLLFAVIIGKVAIIILLLRLLGMPGRLAVLAGLGIGQVGEFAFMLARIGVEAGAVPNEMFTLTLSTALLSIVLSPFLLRLGPPLAETLARLPVIGRDFAEMIEADPAAALLSEHTVICGFGRVGRELADALDAQGFHYLVIEFDPDVVRELRARGVPVIYGDASNPAVLEHAHLERARLLAVLIPDAAAAELATRYARLLNPHLDVVARASDERHLRRLREAGASDVVQPEFEAGVEVIRHALRRYDITGAELERIVARRRRVFYRHWEQKE
jgi:CPA2 family monovalent cation:H+ antiporter-2